MAKYGTIERNVARALEKFPFIKENIKKFYQKFNYMIYKKEKEFYINDKVEIRCINNTSGNFWGYYDKTPVNRENIIYNSFDSSKVHNVRKKDFQEICFNNSKISETNTWNWQQGSMLTWLNKNEIIHNIYVDGEFKSKVINMQSKKERIVDSPIYSVSRDGETALSLNFSRLAKLRPDYGYFNKEYESIQKLDFNDGIYFVDLVKNENKLIISFEGLFNFKTRAEMEGAWHKVNHIEISPNGKRFIFHHRWFDDNGRKWSRLISANTDGTDLYLLSDDDMVSHCIWKNDTEIAGWMRKKEIGDRYYLLKDKSNEFRVIGEGILTEDGHPSFSNDGRWMLTDTYPDKSRMSSLLLYDTKKNELIKLGEFYSPFKYYGETRCDLHPRFNPCYKKLTFDSVHDGVRRMYEVDISKLLEKIS